VTAFLAAAALPCFAETPAELNKMLMEAAKAGDVTRARMLLASGADPNARVPGTWLNFTPLLQAVSEGHAGVAAVLLASGSDPRLEDENGSPPFVFAAKREHEQLARLLMAHGISVDEHDSEGRSAFLRGLNHNALHDLEFMLELGADPNQRGKGGVTPLMELTRVTMLDARSRDSVRERVQLLLRYGARVDEQDDAGNTALLHALDGTDFTLAQWLIEAGANVHLANEDGTTPLLAAVQPRSEERVRYLLERGAQAANRDKLGTTALMLAARFADVPLVKLLLERGVDPKAATLRGRTAAHEAAGSMFTDYTPLERAMPSAAKVVQILKMLDKAGADLDRESADGETPLHAAAEWGHLACLKFLLTRRCDPNAANRKGETPLLLAVGAPSDRLRKMKALVARGAKAEPDESLPETPLMRAAALMDLDAAEYLLSKGAKINRRNAAGETVLAIAASQVAERSIEPKSYTAMLKLLLGKGAGADERNARGMTPLMCASAADMRDAADLLGAAGADIYARSPDGRTPLMWAASCGAVATAQWLIESGAETTAADEARRTALDWAKWMNQPAVVQLPVWNKAAAAAPRDAAPGGR
jgi:ankyrin repeat protein